MRISQGLAGGGKTILCSKVIRHILLNDTAKALDSSIAYFFFDFNDGAKQTVEGMIRSLIVQLVFKLDEVPDDLRALYFKHTSGKFASSLPQFQDWLDILTSRLRIAEIKYIFIDALDECGEEDAYLLLDTLQALFEITGPANKWFLTCRTGHPSISLSQRNGFDHSPMNNAAVMNDIQNYLSTRIETDPRLAPHRRFGRDRIVSSITSKSAGM